MKIFISYRRAVSSDIVGRLRDVLVREFGTEHVFMDVYSIDVGADFRDAIRHAIGSIDALILVIGPRFDTDRLQDDADSLRIEIQEALAQRKLILPLLHGGATVPAAASLPEPIRALAYLNAGQLRADPDFPPDADAVVRRLRAADSAGRSRTTPTAPPTGSNPSPQGGSPEPVASRKRRRLATVLGSIAVLGALGVTIAAPWRSDGATTGTTTSTTMSPAASTEPETSTPEPDTDPNVLASVELQRAGRLRAEVVRDIQTALGAAGFPVRVDGIYGSESERAVVAFQEREALPVTGNVDTRTFQRLLEAAAVPPPTTSTSSSIGAEPAVPKRPALLVQATRLEVKPFGPKQVGTPICGESGEARGSGGAGVFFDTLLVGGLATSLPARENDKRIVPSNGTLAFTPTATDGVVIRPGSDDAYAALTVTGDVIDVHSPFDVRKLATFDHSTPPAVLAAFAADLLGGRPAVEIVVRGTRLYPGGVVRDGTKTDACTSVDLVLLVRLA